MKNLSTTKQQLDASIDALKQVSNNIQMMIMESSNEEFVQLDKTKYMVGCNGTILKLNGTPMSLITEANGYVRVNMNTGDHPVRRPSVHRLVAQCFLPNFFTKGLVVDHIDGDKQNNCVDNLEMVTPKENTRRAKENGLMGRKITAEEKEQMSFLHAKGYSYKKLMEVFKGISCRSIERIVNKK